MDASPFLVRESLLVFKEGGQSNTKVKQNNNNKISLFLIADFPLVNCDISLIRNLPKAQSKQTVVKLEDSKREEKKKSEGLLPRLGLIIIRVAAGLVDTLRGVGFAVLQDKTT